MSIHHAQGWRPACSEEEESRKMIWANIAAGRQFLAISPPRCAASGPVSTPIIIMVTEWHAHLFGLVPSTYTNTRRESPARSDLTTPVVGLGLAATDIVAPTDGRFAHIALPTPQLPFFLGLGKIRGKMVPPKDLERGVVTGTASVSQRLGMSNVLLSGLCYALSSGCLTLLNKHALDGFGFRAPNALLLFQCALSVLLIRVCAALGFIQPLPLKLSVVRVW